MARERYLVGVSEEELQYTPSAGGPQTPKGKLQNLWYHYKWAILGGIFAVFVVTVLTVQAVTREKPDYELCMATSTYIPEAIVEKMEEALQAGGKDLNGDGKVVVQIQALNVETDEKYTQVGTTNRQALMARMVAGDVQLFAFSPSYYKSFCANLEDDFSFFAPLGVKNESVSEDGTYFVWDLVTFAKAQWPDYSEEQIKELLPENLFIGVRAIGEDAKDEKKQTQQQGLDLLRAYFAKN